MPVPPEYQRAADKYYAFRVDATAFPGLIVKDSYWRLPERDQAGNTIDFFVQVLGLTFHDAMKIIIAS